MLTFPCTGVLQTQTIYWVSTATVRSRGTFPKQVIKSPLGHLGSSRAHTELRFLVLRQVNA